MIEVREDTTGPVVERINRVPRQHAGWQSVTYKGERYQLFGGIRGPLFINLSRPITKRDRIMAYTRKNYKTKKALIEDFKAGKEIEVFQPGPFGPGVWDGSTALEGPHYPEPHKWYASATIKDGIITRVK